MNESLDSVSLVSTCSSYESEMLSLRERLHLAFLGRNNAEDSVCSDSVDFSLFYNHRFGAPLQLKDWTHMQH